jgi:hypothetical protein
MSHTKEPIELVDERIPAKDGMSLLGMDARGAFIVWDRADASRLVNCYNALTGVPPGKEQEAMDKVRQMLKTMSAWYSGSLDHQPAYVRMGREAAALLGIGGEK